MTSFHRGDTYFARLRLFVLAAANTTVWSAPVFRDTCPTWAVSHRSAKPDQDEDRAVVALSWFAAAVSIFSKILLLCRKLASLPNRTTEQTLKPSKIFASALPHTYEREKKLRIRGTSPRSVGRHRALFWIALCAWQPSCSAASSNIAEDHLTLSYDLPGRYEEDMNDRYDLMRMPDEQIRAYEQHMKSQR
jgi:hypothetical protein